MWPGEGRRVWPGEGRRVWLLAVDIGNHSRSITESIQLAVKECPGYHGSVALNKEDETRVNAIERELIKLGSKVCYMYPPPPPPNCDFPPPPCPLTLSSSPAPDQYGYC